MKKETLTKTLCGVVAGSLVIGVISFLVDMTPYHAILNLKEAYDSIKTEAIIMKASSNFLLKNQGFNCSYFLLSGDAWCDKETKDSYTRCQIVVNGKIINENEIMCDVDKEISDKLWDSTTIPYQQLGGEK